MVKKDLESRKDIELLVNSFYDKVREDEVIGYIFNDVAKVEWEHHLPVMYNFWEDIILQSRKYSGNPMNVHTGLNQKTSLKTEHFARWKKLFIETVNENFEGPNAEVARQRAVSIATIMQIKVQGN
jgi:hemoglobin